MLDVYQTLVITLRLIRRHGLIKSYACMSLNGNSISQSERRPLVSVDKDINILELRNSFSSLMDKDKVLDVADSQSSQTNKDLLNDDDEEVEDFYVEPDPRILKQQVHSKIGASTPTDEVFNVRSSLAGNINVNLHNLCSKVFKQWKWTSNGVSCSKGSRIILGWNPDIVKVVVIAYDDQVMHTCVHFKDDKKDLFCSVIYAHNRYMQRRALWHNLVTHKAYVRDRPWCILGDFNVSLHVNDKSTGTSYIDRGMRDFQECVDSIEVLDVNSTGLRYTWNQKPKGGEGILKKIDRIMANSDFYDVFVGSSAYFQPYRISDHTPAVLRIPMIAAHKPRPFKFYNILA
ncbi:RNA-directed DNA polymerase, eukaryota, reverse transcriptase zinc-binding domain protein, partial [Tanacetum coccineum]